MNLRMGQTSTPIYFYVSKLSTVCFSGGPPPPSFNSKLLLEPASCTHSVQKSIGSGLWIRNDLFRIRLRIRIRLLRKFRLRLTPDPDPTPDPEPVSDPARLVSASRKLRGIYTNVLVT
jgi:hypothetical protein